MEDSVMRVWYFCKNAKEVGARHDDIGSFVYDHSQGCPKILDALRLDQGKYHLCYGELQGRITANPVEGVSGLGIFEAPRRVCFAEKDVFDEVRRFAKKCARDVMHLWNVPNSVKQYLCNDSFDQAEADKAHSDVIARLNGNAHGNDDALDAALCTAQKGQEYNAIRHAIYAQHKDFHAVRDVLNDEFERLMKAKLGIK